MAHNRPIGVLLTVCRLMQCKLLWSSSKATRWFGPLLYSYVELKSLIRRGRMPSRAVASSVRLRAVAAEDCQPRLE